MNTTNDVNQCFKETTICNFSEYLSLFEEKKGLELFFRGQREDKPLLPKIARNTSLTGKKIIELEQKTLRKFIVRGLPYFTFEPDIRDTIETLTLGQHYGLITRLMDWTTNPLAALWFALKDVTANTTNSPVVWVYKPDPKDDAHRTGFIDHIYDDEPIDVPRTVHFNPKHIDRRLVVQNSVFTIHGNGENREEPTFIPLEKEKTNNELEKVIIPLEASNKLVEMLELCGINDSSMFPDLEGLCRQIKREVF